MNRIDWIKISDEMPPESLDLQNPLYVMLLYEKRGKSSYRSRGKKGIFVTQGYLIDDAKRCASEINPVEFWINNGYGLTFYDYTDRQIQSMTAKASKNNVIAWSYMPNLLK